MWLSNSNNTHSDFIYNLEGEIGHPRDIRYDKTAISKLLNKDNEERFKKIKLKVFVLVRPQIDLSRVTVPNKNSEKDKCVESYFFEMNFYIFLMFEDCDTIWKFYISE